MRLELQISRALAVRVRLIKVERRRQHAIVRHVVPSASVRSVLFELDNVDHRVAAL